MSSKAQKEVNTRRRTLMSFETPTITKSRKSALIKQAESPKTPFVLNQEPVLSLTPKDTDNVTTSSETPKARLLDPVYEKIKRDLNSPSAAARIRAQRALKSPKFCKATYQIFDVPHEEQDIISEEERQPYKPKSIKEVFANCRIYVEVRTGDDNRSSGIRGKLMSEGIQVNEKLYANTTHVIFKDGLLSTYKQAKKLGIPVTTILWIDQCKALRRLVDPSKFPIYNLERYEHPEIYGRIRRQKSMQPQVNYVSTVPQSKTNEVDESALDVSDEDDDATITNDTEMEITAKEVEKTSSDSSIELVTQVEVAETPDTSKKLVENRRITTFTPRPMEQTNIELSQAWKSVDRRRTILNMQLTEENTPKNLTSVTRKTLVFNSANRIGSGTRRSVLDVSMNIFEMNLRAMSEKKQSEKELVEEKDNKQDTSQNDTITQVVKPAIVRKRKLFTADIPDETVEFKENCKTPENNPRVSKKLKCDISMSVKEAIDKRKSKVSTGVDRRKTISFFKTRDNANDSRTAKVVLSKPSPKYICCTNMSSSDREKAQAAIVKLGGIIEKEVSEKTTHVVSQTTDRTMNLLRGIIRACYIVNTDWIFESEKAGMFLDTAIYQHDICNNQKIGERSILGKNFKNLAFSHYGPFYISKDTIDNVKKFEYVKEIIKLCNGSMTNSIKDAKIIVSDRPVVLPSTVGSLLKKPTVVISTYIFDAAMQGKMIPNSKYVPRVV